jgi:hypothetical protein
MTTSRTRRSRQPGDCFEGEDARTPAQDGEGRDGADDEGDLVDDLLDAVEHVGQIEHGNGGELRNESFCSCVDLRGGDAGGAEVEHGYLAQ